jgi:hypothetical protein
MKYKFLNMIVCTVLLVAMLAITAQQNPQALHLGLISSFSQFDPLLTESYSEVVIIEQLFLGLTGLDANGNPVPELAESWQVSDDGLTWTFSLRRGIPWVDSNRNAMRNVTAQDVSFSMYRALQTGNFEGLLETVEVVDEYSVMLILRTPYPDLPTLLAVSPAAKVVPADLVQKYAEQWTQVGTIWTDGPYLLVDQSRQTVQLEFNPYWKAENDVQVRSVLVEFIPNPTEALQRYLRGEFDLIELDPDFRTIVAQESGLAEQIRDSRGTPLELFSQMPFTSKIGLGHSYLVKSTLLPVYSGYFGLGDFHLWGFNNAIPDVQIPGTTRVLNDETLRSLQSMAEDQSVLVFSYMTPQLSMIFIGDIIVGDSTLNHGNEVAPYGFLRRVTNMYTDNSGQFVIETVQAALDEAIESGGQTTDIPLENIYHEETPTVLAALEKPRISPVAYAPTYAGLKISFDEPIYDDDGDLSTKNDQVHVSGYVNIAQGAQVHMDLSIKNHQLESFHFTNTLKQTAELKLYSEVSLLYFDKSVDPAKYTFAPITIFIGPVPVVIVPQLTISVGVNGDVSVNISTGIEQSSTITTTASYENGKWDWGSGISDNHIGPLETELTASASAGAFAGPKLSVLIYGVLGPYAQIKGYITLSGDPTATPLWKLVAGIKGEIGVKLDVLSIIVVKYNFPPIIILPEQVLAQAGGGVVLPTDIPPTSTPSGPVCGSIWWPPSCWPWWIWVVVVVLAIVILLAIFAR